MNEQRVAVVTGANRGIGLEISRQLAQRGIRVMMGSRSRIRSRDAAQALADERLPVTPLQLDVTDPVSIDTAIADTLAAFGRVDVLVNNAGITDGGTHPSTIDLAHAAQVWNTNLTGTWRCAQAVVPTMRKEGYGRIVNITSNLASLTEMTRDSEPAYRVSKAAVHALTRVLAAELDGTGILVNAASPGWTRTAMGGPNAPRGVEKAADTPVWLATLPEDGPTGGYFYDRQRHPW
ncbi:MULTISPECIES: SDR family oxidoreductase [unclassified Nocardiopsis]|uniref:SDR family oxidoreductase n=1 Tax=unclassified Nocardiopsis TaxID=2649073 RepID=UPI00135C08B3|nr:MULTISPECIES: SDR family oxidoreductase [unclassified Nocardiopsis]